MNPKFSFFSFFFFFIAATIAAAAAEEIDSFVVGEESAASLRPEKLTHLRVYWHDVVGGPNPTSVTVVSPAANSSAATFFGLVRMFDNPLTESAASTSRLVGRSQGFYASTSREQSLVLLMAMNFAFTSGEYKGSTVAILGRNEVFDGVREMPIVGGSGRFRLARGYARARTHSLDLRSGDAVVRYDLFVLH